MTSVLSVRLRQNLLPKEEHDKGGPVNRDQWRQELKKHFHHLFFPDDHDGRKRVPWTKMPSYLYAQKKRLIRYPGKGPILNNSFDLAKLVTRELQLLCKANIGLEDWTEGKSITISNHPVWVTRLLCRREVAQRPCPHSDY